MKTAKRNKILMDFAPALRGIMSGTAILAGVIIATAPANAAPVATLTSEAVNGTPYHAGPLIQATVGDLLETAVSSITEGTNGSPGSRHLTSSVYDGLVSSGVANTVAPETRAGYWGSTTPGAHFIEFNLNTGTAPLGYDISNIKVIQRGDGSRPKQAWKVAFKLVGSGTFTDYFTLPQTGTASQVNQVVLTDDTPALLASGVSAIRFDFNDTTGGLGWTWYREIDVIGTAIGDLTPPAVATFSPADNATNVTVGANLVATFNELIAIGTGNITIKNLTDSTQTVIDITSGSPQVTVAGSVLTINPSADLTGAKDYAIQIDAGAITDLTGNPYGGIADDTTWNFATDGTPPMIVTLNPADNATNVAGAANLVVTFNESIAIGTGNITIKNLTDSTQTVIDITSGSPQVTVSGTVLTINPAADLLAGKDYAIQIDPTAIKDISGNFFAGVSDDTTWNFITDGTPPTVATLNPADNATGVAVGANLVVTFNEAIAVGTGNITIKNLTDATQSTIAITSGSPQVSLSGAVLTINPAADLLAGKSYAIQIDATAIKDATGNLFAGIADDTTWNFVTTTGVAVLTAEVANGSPYHAGPLIQATVGDLLETALSSSTQGGNGGVGNLASSVYDGLISTGVSNSTNAQDRAGYWGSTTPGAHFIEFNLDTVAAPLGYDVSSIKVIQRGDGFRPRQAWKVAFKPVGSGSFTDYFTLPATGVSSQVNQVVLTDGAAALLASGVSAIRFDFGDTGGGYGWTWYREIDVLGSATSTSGYAAWAGGAAFGDDANGDGVKNGLAWLLGAASPNAGALSLLPVPTETAGGLKLNFNMLNAANRGMATLSVEHSSDLGIGDPWSTVVVPDADDGPTSGVTFTVTPGSPTNAVEAVISNSEESADGKLFGRLKATGP